MAPFQLAPKLLCLLAVGKLPGGFMNFSFLALSITLLTSSVSQAQTGVTFGKFFYNGSGCPKESASFAFSPNQNQLSIMFDQFVAKGRLAANKSVDEKSCAISIPIQLPPGYSVSISQIELQGFNLTPSVGTLNRFDVDHFLGSIRGPHFSKAFIGSLGEKFQETSGLLANASPWTPCGSSTTLRMNINIRSQTNAQMEDTMMILDSGDTSAAMALQLKLKECR